MFLGSILQLISSTTHKISLYQLTIYHVLDLGFKLYHPLIFKSLHIVLQLTRLNYKTTVS